MPPIENELAESDFNDAVTLHLYLFERQRDEADAKTQADRTAYSLARILAPGLGLELREDESGWG